MVLWTCRNRTKQRYWIWNHVHYEKFKSRIVDNEVSDNIYFTSWKNLALRNNFQKWYRKMGKKAKTVGSWLGDRKVIEENCKSFIVYKLNVIQYWISNNKIKSKMQFWALKGDRKIDTTIPLWHVRLSNLILLSKCLQTVLNIKYIIKIKHKSLPKRSIRFFQHVYKLKNMHHCSGQTRFEEDRWQIKLNSPKALNKLRQTADNRHQWSELTDNILEAIQVEKSDDSSSEGLCVKWECWGLSDMTTVAQQAKGLFPVWVVLTRGDMMILVFLLQSSGS